MNFGKGLAKLAIVGAVMAFVLWPERDERRGAAHRRYLDRRELHLLADRQAPGELGLAILTLVALADWLYQRHAWYERQRMTVQELKEEFKQSEGNPEIKAKIRQLRRQRASKRMMANVPKASVVITNPTHFAVALRYETGMGAPGLRCEGRRRARPAHPRGRDEARGGDRREPAPGRGTLRGGRGRRGDPRRALQSRRGSDLLCHEAQRRARRPRRAEEPVTAGALSSAGGLPIFMRGPHGNISMRLAPCLLLVLLTSQPAAAAPALARIEGIADVVEVASGLEHPWGLAFLPDGRFLVTERPGRMRVVDAGRHAVGAAVAGVPESWPAGRAVCSTSRSIPDFARNRFVFSAFRSRRRRQRHGGGPGRGSTDARRCEDVRVIFRQQPKVASSNHFGCRSSSRATARFSSRSASASRARRRRRPRNHLGKIVRIDKDGSAPARQPVRRPGGRAAARSGRYGHRNVQGAALDPDGKLWTHEHGPHGGDEINVPEAGRNYGWPVISYGENYCGAKIGERHARRPAWSSRSTTGCPRSRPPAWPSSPATAIPAWQGNLFVGSLRGRLLDRLELDGGRMRPRSAAEGSEERIRDVRQGPDGLIYLAHGSGSRLASCD